MSSRSPVKGRAISVRGGLVVKRQEPQASRRERLRTLAGREVGRRTGLFVVPEIVAFDDARGEIVFERLQLTELQRALSGFDRSIDLVGRAARSLAAIHGQMESTDRAATITTEETAGGFARHPVALHGDFALRNVLYLADSDRIAVIDWSNADWTGVDGDLGAPELDVAVFLISLFHRRLFGPSPVSRRDEIARHFLATYASASPHGVDIAALRGIVAAVTPGFHRHVQRRKGRLRALGYRHSMVDLDFFLSRLSGVRFPGRREHPIG